MNGSMTDIPVAGGGTFPGYLAAPASLRGPGLLVLPDIYNMTPYIKTVADDFAAEGYLALVPDLFWRIRPGIGLAWGDPGRAEGRAYSAQLDIDRLVGDLDAAASFLRAHAGSTGRVGCMGYCLGGRLACLLAARTGIDAAVGYYAVDLDQHLAEIAATTRPLLLHFGALDGRVPLDLVDRVRAAARDRPNIAIHVYDGAGHGFSRKDIPPHHPDAARLAHQRTLDLLRDALGPAARGH